MEKTIYTRDELIDDLVTVKTDGAYRDDREWLGDVLRCGHRGLDDYTDKELVVEYEKSCASTSIRLDEHGQFILSDKECEQHV